MSTPAFSRSRSPIRGSDGSVSSEAKWRAGWTYARRVRRTVTRSAWSIRPAPDLVVAGEQRQDRQAGRVGARSSRPGAAASSAGSTSRPSPRSSRRAGPASVEQLVEPAGAAVDQQRVPVAVRVAAALDVDAARDRVAHAVGLVRVLEAHARARRALADDVVGDPDRAALVGARAEVGVQAVVEPDRGDDRVRAGQRPGGGRRAGWSRTSAGTAGSRRCGRGRRGRGEGADREQGRNGG